MNADAGSALALLGVIAVIVWGLVPRRRHGQAELPAPAQTPPSPVEDPALARQVGVVTGVLGGSIEDAAVARYALSRLDQPPTATDIGVAAGVQAEVRHD